MAQSTKKSKRTASPDGRRNSSGGKSQKKPPVDMARIRRILQADKERHPEKWTDAVLAERMAARQRKKEEIETKKRITKEKRLKERQMLKEQRAGMTIAPIKVVPKYFVDQVNSYKWLAKWRGPKWTRFLYLVKRASEQPVAMYMRVDRDENWLEIATRWRNAIQQKPADERKYQYQAAILDALTYIEAGTNYGVQDRLYNLIDGHDGANSIANDRRYGMKALRKLIRLYLSMWTKTAHDKRLFRDAQRVLWYFLPAERLLMIWDPDYKIPGFYIVPGWLFMLWRVKLHQEGLRKPRTRVGNTVNAKANMILALRTFKDAASGGANPLVMPEDTLVENLCIELLRKYFIQGTYTLANAQRGVKKLFKEFHSMEARIPKVFENLYLRGYQLMMYIGVLSRLYESRMSKEWIVPPAIRSNNIDDYIAAIKRGHATAKQARLHSVREKMTRNRARRAELLAISNARRQTASARHGSGSRGRSSKSLQAAGSTDKRSASASRSPNRTQSAVKATAAAITQRSSASRLART